MDFVGGKTDGSANGVVIGVFDVEELDISVVLVFVADHGEHLCHGVVDMFHASISAGMICTRCELMYP